MTEPGCETSAIPSIELDRLRRDLTARFCPPLRSEEIESCLIECARRFDHARIRLYLAVLIERAATERLRARVDDRDEQARFGRCPANVTPLEMALSARITRDRADVG